MKLINIHQIKLATGFFCMAVFLLVAKPFLGFSMFNRISHTHHANIYVKAFTKRKQEFAEDSVNNVETVQKKLADPVKALLIHFSFFLGLIFPAVFSLKSKITNSFINRLQLSLSPQRETYLLNSNFLI